MAKKSAKENPEFDYKTIKTFEDACKKESIDPLLFPDVSIIPEGFRSPIINAFKLMVIFKAINNGWVPDWNNWNQYKYYPWFRVSSGGVGFSSSDYYSTDASASVGSRLCTDSSEKALYIASQFENEYKEYFLYL